MEKEGQELEKSYVGLNIFPLLPRIIDDIHLFFLIFTSIFLMLQCVHITRIQNRFVVAIKRPETSIIIL